ncbi:glycosyltransferase [Stenotrophomonas sp. Sa5BUN4]|uniref:Glycosyltransferase n=1 Tax=Stenotrophomonas lacuserhaii TaxID=2760084 RepID=A0A8X8FWS7_9GAMM|nr:glycosyltransferase [Stenotrophomonas pennii]MBD7955799.1 glycosyltransferase [Stenotrophomonas pennii]
MRSSAPGSTSAPRVGVVLCAFNGERHLATQLDSILGQTRSVDEIVLADDASTDATAAILAAFAQRARRQGVSVLLLENQRTLGCVQNFAAALQRATADIILLCDQDDRWHPTRVQDCLGPFAADHSLLLLHADARLVDATGTVMSASLFDTLRIHPAEISLERSALPVDALLLRNVVTGATCALRRELLALAMPMPSAWLHDEWLALIAALHGGLDVQRAASIDYRQHAGNHIGARRETLLQRIRRLDLLSREGRARMQQRFAVLDQTLQRQGVCLAPPRWTGLQAICWRMAASRLLLYRQAEVEWRWVLHDLTRLIGRVVAASWAGAGWRGPCAALHAAALVALRRRLPA